MRFVEWLKSLFGLSQEQKRSSAEFNQAIEDMRRNRIRLYAAAHDIQEAQTSINQKLTHHGQ